MKRSQRWMCVCVILVASIAACSQPGENSTPIIPSATVSEAAAEAGHETATPPPPSPEASSTATPQIDTLARQTTNLPDDLSGKQVHLMYVLPGDGVDRELDTNGVIRGTVAAWQHWLANQTGGRTIRLDTYQGELDITFYRLERTEADLAQYNEFMRDELEVELLRAGFGGTDRLLAVYYDGLHNKSCGDSFWPPVKAGSVAAMYLNGLPDFEYPCASNPFAPSIDQPGYLEFAMLHEVLHAIGITPECAPNHTRAGHTSDSNTDLMYAGDEPWYPGVLDVGNDDYYQHENEGCLDLDDSEWLTE